MNNPANAVQEFCVLVDDGTAADSLGCNNLVNAAALSGKIAFVYRGSCEFGTKALRAQQAGAIAVVVINNAPGVMSMGAGAEGGNVTIPVVMISQETGAILRPFLTAGTLKIFLGSKQNLFANDLGMTSADIIRPLNFATPRLLAGDNTEFVVKVGAKVRNFGNQAQSGITLNAKVLLNGTTQVYNENVNAPATLASGDSVSLTLPDFSLPNNNAAKYTLTYTVSASVADEANVDNVISQDFLITDGVYSKSRYDQATQAPIRTSGLTSANGSNIKWGVLMNAVKGSRVKANSIKFTASTNAPDSLTGIAINGTLAEWTDANADGGVSDDELVDLTFGSYVFASNLQNTVVTMPFDDQIALADDKIYYISLEYAGNKTMFFGVDEELNYTATIDAFSQSINPLKAPDGTWYGGGFGADKILAISVQTSVNNASVEENEMNLNLSVFPNPATDVVNVKFGNAVADANVQLTVIDVAGRSVINKQYNVANAENYVSVNTADLANGTYFFKVSVNGQAVKSIPVVISR